jgi:hypothetical protein
LLVPNDFFAQPIGNIAQMIGFREWACIAKGTACDCITSACIKPLLVVSCWDWQKWFGRREVLEVVFGEKEVFAVI